MCNGDCKEWKLWVYWCCNGLYAADVLYEASKFIHMLSLDCVNEFITSILSIC